VTVSATGPAASLGMPEKNTVDLLPREIAGQKIEYLVLDDASDTTSAVNNTRKFITENQVDLVMGSTISPNALAMIDVVAEAKVPMIAFAASEKIVSPVDDKRRWVLLVAAQLPDDHPAKASALEYVQAYEAKFGKGSVSTFGAHVWDAGKLLAAALPEALTKAKPGTPEFRAALRDALEHLKEVHAAMGVFTMSPTDHLGLDRRARVIVRIDQGTWRYVP